MRKSLRKLLVNAALVTAVALPVSAFAGTGTAYAAGGGQFCAAGSGTSDGYACVSLGGYNRWLPLT